MDSYSESINNSTNGAQSFLMGSGALSQLLLTLVLALILYILMMTLESMYILWSKAEGSRVDVFPYRANAQNNVETIAQNPAITSAITLSPSMNERTGIEFSYSFFLLLNSNGFSAPGTGGTATLKHVFHKGYSKMYPLMSPGVFVHSNENKLRVYVNSPKQILNFVDVTNVPVNKWVHVVLSARKNALEVYINGNIIKKLSVDGVLMQNYQDVILFSQRAGVRLGEGADALQVTGSFNGDLASLTYFSYAISYSEIQGLNAVGPSKETKKGGMADVATPYLVDNWWTSGQ